MLSGISTQPNSPLPTSYSAHRYHKRKQEEEEAGIKRRTYERKSSVLCRQCNKERHSADHSQYNGNDFCHNTATQSLDTWRDKQFEAKILEEKGKLNIHATSDSDIIVYSVYPMKVIMYIPNEGGIVYIVYNITLCIGNDIDMCIGNDADMCIGNARDVVYWQWY